VGQDNDVIQIEAVPRGYHEIRDRRRRTDTHELPDSSLYIASLTKLPQVSANTEIPNLAVRSEDACPAVTEIGEGRPQRPFCAVSWEYHIE
jgi:hypothetical protein